MLIREEIRERQIHLAASEQRNGVADAGTTVDVTGRDRLAPADSYAGATDGGVRRGCFPLRTFLR